MYLMFHLVSPQCMKCFIFHLPPLVILIDVSKLFMVLEARLSELEACFCSSELPEVASVSQDKVAAVECPSIATACCSPSSNQTAS